MGVGKDRTDSREKIIVRTGTVGIVANLLLASAKAVAGFAAGSIAMVLDAVNNTSDSLSSVITIIGTKLANRKPDKKHPLGHGRIEYLTQIIIAGIILYAGITALIESVKKIIEPSEADFKAVQLIVISVAIFAKIGLGLYFRSNGKKARSELLTASGTDALFDAVLSTAVLISAAVYLIFKVNIEAYVSILISLFILKAGIDIIREAVDDMLGHRVEGSVTGKVKKTVAAIDGVYGVYDVVLHNYGPDKYLGSLHIEVDDTTTADKIDALTREIEQQVYLSTGVILTAVGVYSRNTGDDEFMAMRSEITRLVMSHENVIQMHGFYIDGEKKRITFDIIINFDEKDTEGLYNHIMADVKEAAPGFEVHIQLDYDISDIDS